MNKQQKQALTAGVALLIMAIVAGFSYGYVQSTLVVDSAEQTVQNLAAQKSLFIVGVLGWIVIFMTDLIVAIALFGFYKASNAKLSGITAMLRILYTFILGMGILQLFKIIPLIPMMDETLNYNLIQQLPALFNKFTDYWSIGLIAFGFHLLGLAFLSMESKTVPSWLGYLLFVGGLGYIFIHSATQFQFLSENVISKTERILSIPMALAEILLAIWLIKFAVKKEK